MCVPDRLILFHSSNRNQHSQGKGGRERGVRDYEKIVEEAKASLLPYESWERLPGESGAAFAVFCVFRDYGLRQS